MLEFSQRVLFDSADAVAKALPYSVVSLGILRNFSYSITLLNSWKNCFDYRSKETTVLWTLRQSFRARDCLEMIRF